MKVPPYLLGKYLKPVQTGVPFKYSILKWQEKNQQFLFRGKGGVTAKNLHFIAIMLQTNLPNLKSGSVRGPFPLSYKVAQSIYRYFINNFTKQCNKSIIEYHSKVAAPVNHMRFSNCKYLILDMYRMFHFNSLKNKMFLQTQITVLDSTF